MKINKIAILLVYQEDANSFSSFSENIRFDAESYKCFLKSPYGGAWNDSEIIIRFSPSKQEILQIINDFVIGVDYAMICFWGHGYYSEDEDDVILQINSTEVFSALLFRNKAIKTLIVLDCYRIISEQKFLAESVEYYVSGSFSIDIVACREYYEKCIIQANTGNTVMYACSPYVDSFDDARGGVYTKNLLHIARQWIQNTVKTAKSGTCYCLSVVEAHREASILTERQLPNQHSDIEKNRSGAYLPFVVAIYKEVL